MLKEVKRYLNPKLGQDYNDALVLLNKVIELRYSDFKYKYDDLISIGVEGILKWLKTYKPDKGCKFTSYIYRRLPQYLGRSLNKENFGMSFPTRLKFYDLPYSVVSDHNLGLKDDEEYDVAMSDDWQDVQNIEDKIYRTQRLKIVERELNKLQLSERDMLYLKYGFKGSDYNYDYIGSTYGITKGHAKSKLHNIIKKVRNRIERNKLYKEL